ncbi:alpha/beta fold hydrolase [Gramella sp. KN1008]|uniref:alpha/beta fold hydrolase n=1 Tax=Gramella sp. KN1008 TaxID=2529298 RepID=UPI00103928EB|nr:alpha/beta hydrolase [Gramella sp. KN1008]TBW26557.1 alpha/beta hydrolase [Gramella sp. KN1008]
MKLMKNTSFLLILLFLFTWSKAFSQSIDTLIDVGNHKLHFKILKGAGTPILFEAGNGDDASVWKKILKPIQESTGATIITYDRAGLGKSGIDTLAVNFQQEVIDLERALQKLGVNNELFIVSHSFGGFYSTLFANRNKERVKGAVFIDVALPCFFTKEWSANYVSTIAEKDWKMLKEYRKGLFYVLKNLEQISGFMSDKSLPNDLPVSIIAAENLPAMVKPHEAQKWRECLKSFGCGPNRNYILASNAEHKIWADQPEIVINEISKLYNEVNKNNK